MAPGDLQEVLAVLKPDDPGRHTDLLVGLGRADDAAVYRISGAVAAANAMSDVYAMGGEVMFALAVAGFPRELPKKVVAEVFRGGAEKVTEAGGVIAGGHTVV